MNPNTFPTKGNLILAKNSLALAKQGFDLMDKKRNILMREIMNLISQASEIRPRSTARSGRLTASCSGPTSRWVSMRWRRFPFLSPWRIP